MAILTGRGATRAATTALVLTALVGCTTPESRRQSDAAAPPPEPEPVSRAMTAPDAGPGKRTDVEVDPAPAPDADEPKPDLTPEPAPAPEPVPEPEPEPELKPRPVPTPAEKPEPQPAQATAPVPSPEPAVESASISGRVTLSGGDAAVGQTVMYFVPDEGSTVQLPTGSPAEIVTRNKVLDPTVLVVPTGTRVQFPNRDPILHNLFSLSPGNQFDLGIYGPGDAPSTTLSTPGTVNIFCNVHHDMHAHVLVVDTPFYTRAEADGRFELTELPIGSGTLHAWHRQGPAWSKRIELPASEPVAVALEITRPNLPPHRDKRGQSYQRRDRDPYR